MSHNKIYLYMTIVMLVIIALILIREYSYGQEPSGYDMVQDAIQENDVFEQRNYFQADTHYTLESGKKITELEKLNSVLEIKVKWLVAILSVVGVALAGLIVTVLKKKVFNIGVFILAFGVLTLTTPLSVSEGHCYTCEQIPCTADQQCIDAGCLWCDKAVQNQEKSYRSTFTCKGHYPEPYLEPY